MWHIRIQGRSATSFWKCQQRSWNTRSISKQLPPVSPALKIQPMCLWWNEPVGAWCRLVKNFRHTPFWIFWLKPRWARDKCAFDFIQSFHFKRRSWILIDIDGSCSCDNVSFSVKKGRLRSNLQAQGLNHFLNGGRASFRFWLVDWYKAKMIPRGNESRHVKELSAKPRVAYQPSPGT